MKFGFTIIIFGAIMLQLGANSYWKLKDGTGNLTVKDSGSNQLHGSIVDPERCVWSREDDRGFFLNFNNGGAVRVRNGRALILEQGFVLDIHFSCNIDAIGKSGFASLFSKGKDGEGGYSVMIGKQGELLVRVRRIVPGQKILPLGLKSNVDYRLQITVGDNKVKIKLNDREVAEYSYKGTIGILGQELYIGSIPKYPFSGNIYEVKLAGYGEKIDWKRNAILDFKPRPVKDPAGTVVLSDFTTFSPKELILLGTRADINYWRLRTGVDFYGNNCTTMVYPPAEVNSGEISIDPGLKGKYDVYLSIRCLYDDTRIQMRIGGQPDYYTITAYGVGAKHRSIEALVQRDVEMDGTRLYLASAGTAYVGYIKLIPSASRRKSEVLDPAGNVTRGPRLTQVDVDGFLQKQIDEKFKSGFFVERVYVEKKTAAKPSAESEKRGYQLFNRNWMDLLFDVSVPETDTGKISLKTAAAPGEFEPVSFGVRGLRNISRLTLKQLSDFKDSEGRIIPVKVDIGVVEAIAKRTTNYTGSSEVMTAPQYIENSDSLTLKKGESRQFWLTLQPADDAPAGVCSAVFELSDGTTVEKIPVELKVYPFKLDKLKNMDISLFSYNEERTPEEIERTVKDMADHGCTTLYCYTNTTLAFKGDTPETFAVDWENSTLPPFMKSFRAHGMSGRVHLTLPGAYYAVEERFPKQWREVYSRILKEIEAKRKSEGWPDFVYWSFDEVLSNTNLIPHYKRDVKLQKELGLTTGNDHIWYKTARFNQKDCDEIAPFIDVFINRFNTKNFWYVDTWDQMMKRCKELGKELIPYNSNNAITFAQPAAARYSFGWFARTAGLGISGHFIYVYRLIYNNPYNDLDGTCTDWIFHYPPFNGRKGGPSLDWESYREGVDDLRYIVTLENLIAEAEKKNVDASKAKQLLASLATSFDMKKFYKESRFIDPKWDRLWEEKSGKRCASGRFNVPNGWNLEDYDLAREKIANEIINLGKLLKKQ